MTEAPDRMIATPDLTAPDPLDDLLSGVRLCGAVFLRGEYAAPWALSSPPHATIRDLLAPGCTRLVLFHIVSEGRAWVTAEGQRLELEAGDLVVLPHGHANAMGSPGCNHLTPIAELLPPPPWQAMPVVRIAGSGARTQVVLAGMVNRSVRIIARVSRPRMLALSNQPARLFNGMMLAIGRSRRGVDRGEDGDVVATGLPKKLHGCHRLHDAAGVDQRVWCGEVLDAVQEEGALFGDGLRGARIEGNLSRVGFDLRKVRVDRPT